MWVPLFSETPSCSTTSSSAPWSLVTFGSSHLGSRTLKHNQKTRKPRGLVGVGAAVWWVTYILYLYQMILDIVDIMQQIPGLILDILLYICRQHAVVVFPLQYLFWYTIPLHVYPKLLEIIPSGSEGEEKPPGRMHNHGHIDKGQFMILSTDSSRSGMENSRFVKGHQRSSTIFSWSSLSIKTTRGQSIQRVATVAMPTATDPTVVGVGDDVEAVETCQQTFRWCNMVQDCIRCRETI